VETYDAIVLGLGAAGSAALYQLARRGVRALGIDQFSPPHTLGSTHGETRITRLAIGEGAHYTPLAVRSHQIWRELEAATGQDLLTTNGGLIISGASSGSEFHGASFFETTVEAARKHGIAHALLDAGEIRRRFRPFAVGDHERGYFEPTAGFLRPEACVAAQLQEAVRLGAELRLGGAALEFEEGPHGVTVVTDADRYAGDRLVVAAGPWLPRLLPPQRARHFKVYRQVLFWFDIEARYLDFTPERFPVFIWELPRGRGAIYGFPAVGGPGGGFKVATEQFETETTPGAVAREVSPAESDAMYHRFVAPFFPDAGPRCVRSATCLYTVTRDFGFVVDRLPGSERVIVASPCSGHGFKHSAALGEAIADLVSGGDGGFDLGAFSFARFGDTPASGAEPRPVR
jgi:sarcosine oxidase